MQERIFDISNAAAAAPKGLENPSTSIIVPAGVC